MKKYIVLALFGFWSCIASGQMQEIPIRHTLKAYTPSPNNQGSPSNVVDYSLFYGCLATQYAANRKSMNNDEITKLAMKLLNNYQEKVDDGRGQLFPKVLDNATNVDKYLSDTQHPFKVTGYKILYDEEEGTQMKINKIKKALIEYKPVMIAMKIYTSFYTAKDIWSGDINSYAGNHAMLIVGWDDHSRTFELMNSWGTNWGNQGYIKIKYSDLTKNSSEGYTIDMKILTSNDCSLIWFTPNPDEEDNATYTDNQLPIKVKAIGNPNLTASDFKVYVNNQLQTGKAGERSLRGTTFQTTVTLREGNNNIHVKVGNNTSKTIKARYSAKKPNLYLLTFAPSYDNNTSASSLKYTAKDAQAFKAAFQAQQKKGVYDRVTIKELTGSQATAYNFRIELESITNLDIKERDIVMIFASSHGSKAGEEFALKGDDFRAEAPSATSIPASFISGKLSQLNCKKLLFIDACYAGGFTGGKDDDEIIAINQTLEALTNAQSFMATFTSSSGSQKSYESPKWQHGAFTKALLDGLSGNADMNYNRQITLDELYQYLEKEVPRLVQEVYKKQQIPAMHLKGVNGDLPIFVY